VEDTEGKQYAVEIRKIIDGMKLTPDITLPVQHREPRLLRPVQQLSLAVLKDAVDCLRGRRTCEGM